MDACVAETKASFSEDPTERNSDRSRSRKSYPDEALGNPKRMKEWDNTHAGGRIQPRARTKEQHQTLIRYKWWCEDNGLGICHLMISHAQADMAGLDEAKRLKKAGPTVINLQQQNTFVSQIERPRRSPDPGLQNKEKRDISGTTYRAAFESYVLLKALHMHQSFMFRDFLEISPNHFRKIILRLKKKDLISPTEPRSCPRTYSLTSKFLMQLCGREY